MKTFNVVIQVTDKYDRYRAEELIPEFSHFLSNLDLEVKSISSTVLLSGGDDYCSNCGSQLTDSEAAAGSLCIECR